MTARGRGGAVARSFVPAWPACKFLHLSLALIAMASTKPDPYVNLGEFIKRQRELAQLSIRQLAEMCGVSNPYLSQIERGLRIPSSMILQSLAKGLRLSAETLYTQAGIMDPQEAEESDVVKAVMRDPDISARQREMLIDMYRSFRKVNEAEAAS